MNRDADSLEPLVRDIAQHLAPVRGPTGIVIVTKLSLAQQLLAFLSVKIAFGDTSPRYNLSPPAHLDTAWHTLLLETSMHARVIAELGGTQVHHSSQQPGGDEGHSSRMLSTCSAVIHVSEGSPVHSSAAFLMCRGLRPFLHPLIWGLPPRGHHIVHVHVLRAPSEGEGEGEGGSAGTTPVLQAVMPSHATLEDLATFVLHLYGQAVVRFRSLSLRFPAAPVCDGLLHPGRLLSGIDGGTRAGDTGKELTLQAITAVDMAAAASGFMPMPTGPIKIQGWTPDQPAERQRLSRLDTVSLVLERGTWDGLPPLAPALSLLTLPCSFTRSVSSTYELLDCSGFIPDMQALGDLEGRSLVVEEVLAQTVMLSVRLHCPETPRGGPLSCQIVVPECWTLDDLTVACGLMLRVDPAAGMFLIMADGVPAPADLSYKSPLPVLICVVQEADTAAAFFQVFVKDARGKIVTVVVSPSWTALDLKVMLQCLGHGASHSQRLICAGKQLEDGVMLGRYNIRMQSTIHLYYPLRGC